MISRRLLLSAAALLFACLTSLHGADAERGSAEEKKETLTATSVANLPNILIVGDSISIGYMKPLQRIFKGKANIVHPKANCESTVVGIANLSQWMGTTSWSVIHFNFGLHDIKHVSDTKTGKASTDAKDPRWVEPEQYRGNLEKIVGILERSGAKLVFATTTPAPEEHAATPQTIYREAADVVTYNEIARQVMSKHHIPVNDLYSFAEPKLRSMQKPKNVHFTDPGSEALARQVARSVVLALKAPKR